MSASGEKANEKFAWKWFAELSRRDRYAFIAVALCIVTANVVNIVYSSVRYINGRKVPATKVTFEPKDEFVNFGVMICDQKELFLHWDPSGAQTADVFECTSTGLLVPLSYRCNGYWECEDGEDEYGCDDFDYGDCDGQFEFQCGNGQCIPNEYVCDHYDDCTDKLDEADCGRDVFCDVVDEYTCGDGGCVPWQNVCDGYDDCLDYSDEDYCDYDGVSHCPLGYVECPNSYQCIYDDFLCDCYPDCIDSSTGYPNFFDELGSCTYEPSPPCCSQLEFECLQDRECDYDWIYSYEYSECFASDLTASTCWESNPNNGGTQPTALFNELFECHRQNFLTSNETAAPLPGGGEAPVPAAGPDPGPAPAPFADPQLFAKKSTVYDSKRTRNKPRRPALQGSDGEQAPAGRENSVYFHSFECVSSDGNGTVLTEKNCGRPFQVPFAGKTLSCAYVTDPLARNETFGVFKREDLRREWTIMSNNNPRAGWQPLFVIPFYIKAKQAIHAAAQAAFNTGTVENLAGATANVLYGSQVSMKMAKEKLTDLNEVETIRITGEPSFDRIVNETTVSIRVTGAVIDFTEVHITELPQFGAQELFSAILTIFNTSMSVFAVIFPSVALVKTQRMFKLSNNKPEMLDPNEVVKVKTNKNDPEELEMDEFDVPKPQPQPQLQPTSAVGGLMVVDVEPEANAPPAAAWSGDDKESTSSSSSSKSDDDLIRGSNTNGNGTREEGAGGEESGSASDKSDDIRRSGVKTDAGSAASVEVLTVSENSRSTSKASVNSRSA